MASESELQELLGLLSEVYAGNRSDGPAMSNVGWLKGLVEDALRCDPLERDAALRAIQAAKPILLSDPRHFEPYDVLDESVLGRAWSRWKRTAG